MPTANPLLVAADLFDPPPSDLDRHLAEQAAQTGQPAWQLWLRAVLPGHFPAPFAAHHAEFWAWLESVAPSRRPSAFVAVWSRGGAKSTSAEAACVKLGAQRRRRYGLYVCDVQDRADDHVGNIGSMLESDAVARHYPAMAARKIGKHGNSRGWRRNRLWAADGFVVDAIGLDTAARGVKLEDQRPDFLVVDDIDARHDSPALTRRKIETLTEDLIPAGADDLAVLAIQNLVHAKGVFARLVSGDAEFLRYRKVSGPVPALRGMRVERHPARCVCERCGGLADLPHDVIVAGDPSWLGQDVARCQEMLNDMTLRAFRRECQHEVTEVPGALWLAAQLDAARLAEPPELEVTVVGVDPSGGEGDGHDEQGIIAVGRAAGHGFVLADRSCSLSPMGWGKRAVMLAIDVDADRIVVEANYGGDMAANTIRVAADALALDGVDGAARYGSARPSGVKIEHASRGKRVRAEPVAACWGEKERPETWADATMHMVGGLPILEDEMTGWDPDIAGQSPNRVDALVWAATDLGLAGQASPRRGGLRYRGTAA